ncbi:hypothetical protein B5E77_14695 [Lachnoclostridium sp. An131]|uniref:DUF3793 family protein n=1 Tax=Lachnoclostridium sp. An131 TaxID=1965555 RepID=UPI000B383EE3|nr:DUF3793 family protein [Lachnoclostridium sp. An131]OUQ23917.1 hypothetical protein B5E77_14695 [Lachnoclostridium sp. An131]
MDSARERLERLLANHCAPVFCGQKTANLVAAPQELAPYLPEILMGSRICWVKLCGCRKYCHLLFYEKERMERYLAGEKHQDFLKAYGYEGGELSGKLQLLAERYERYQKRGGKFPHEIGLFLEYPLEDIEGFIVHQGRNALECGYWKVYGNVERAREVFRLYDGLRETLTAMVAAGFSLREGVAEAVWRMA